MNLTKTQKEVALWSGVAGLFVMWLWNEKDEVADLIARGSKVTNSHWFNNGNTALSQSQARTLYGFVDTKPDALHEAASRKLGYQVSPDLYAAARMIRSEGHKQGAARLHIAFNDLDSFPYADNLFELLTYSTDPQRRGYYGSQWSGKVAPFAKANARRYSTAKDPYEGDFKQALEVFKQRDAGQDPTRGATRFIDISSMGVQPGTSSFAQKDAEWKAQGFESFTLPGDSDFVLYRKV